MTIFRHNIRTIDFITVVFGNTYGVKTKINLYFNLSPLENSLDSILFMEMWDFIPNEIIQKNITKSIISKQMKALKRALKNIVQTTTFSRQEKKPIACTEIFLKVYS